MEMSTSARLLLGELRRRGLSAVFDPQDRTMVVSPGSALTPDLLRRIKANQSALVAAVKAAPSHPIRPEDTPDTGPEFHYARATELQFGDVPIGTSPAAWTEELKRRALGMIDRRADVSMYFMRWFFDLDRKLQAQSPTVPKRAESTNE
jgi:hypothetical protein